ncbi:hypothetical protein [Sulfurisphaera ohwakuensis]|uniref:hypothetical protein n=1 Tax=Sulfurisphaera ohwakuensis TaxID=69656 RepID=UPI0036F26D21
MKNEIIIFSIIFSTIAPAILATTHLSIYVALPTFLLVLVIAYLTYLLVNVKWDYKGLYAYAQDFHPLIGYIFLASWLGSYYPYTIYTAIYIPYYVLNLDGITAVIISLIVEVIVIVALLTSFYYIFPIIAFSQLALVLPFGWKLGLGVTPPIPSLFLDILSSSVIIVCITLSTFIKADKRFSNYILYSVLIGGIMLFYSSFLSPSSLAVYGEAIGNFGLIMAEFLMIKNLLSGLQRENIVKYLAIASIPLVGIGNLNYTLFYNTLIVPSVALLYVSLFLSFLSVFKYFNSLKIKILGSIALLLFIYGEYNVIATSKGYLLYEAIGALILSILIGISVYSKRKHSFNSIRDLGKNF